MNHAVRVAFSVLDAAGFKAPASYASERGMDQAIAVYQAALNQITADELSAAVQAWITGSVPFWPKPGELIGVVPGIDEARIAWYGRDTSPGLFGIVIRRELGNIEDYRGHMWCKAWRELRRRWLALPVDERIHADRLVERDGVRFIVRTIAPALIERPLLLELEGLERPLLADAEQARESRDVIDALALEMS